MTTGSWSTGNVLAFPTTPGDLYNVKSWSGADRTRLVRAQVPPTLVNFWYQNQKGAWVQKAKKSRLYGLKDPVSGTRPQNRVYDVPHDYSVDRRFAREGAVQAVIPVCNTSTHRFEDVLGPVSGIFAYAGTPTWAPATLIDENSRINLVLRLKSKIQGSDFNPSVFLAELPEAMGMITHAADRIYHGYRDLRKGNFYGAALSLVGGNRRAVKATRPDTKDLASQWLELQYGWLPLLSDAKSGAEMLAHQLNVPLQRRYVVRMRRENNQEHVVQWGASGTVCGTSLRTGRSKSTRTEQLQYIALVQEKPTIPKLLGMLDPELVAWELMPYSFVADWFIPIGDWLTARGFAQGLVGKFIMSRKLVGKRHVPESDFWVTVLPTSDWVWTQFSRTVTSSLSPAVPMPAYKGLNAAASWKHCANAVALLRQKFGSK